MKIKCPKCGTMLDAAWDSDAVKEIYEAIINCPKCGEYRAYVYGDGNIIPNEVNNPKVIIVSDGIKTVLYVDKKKIERAMECDFSFHADTQEVDLTYKNYKTNGEGIPVVTGNELVTETHTWHR